MNIYRKSDIPPHLLKYFEPVELGLEKTPEEYVAKMVEVFREVRRVLKPDGTLFLNLGDSYFGSWGNYGGQNRGDGKQMKPKDLVGIPWRVALALQADGWWLRQDIIWSKPNSMPESVRDRCTKAHEYIFLLTKSARYYYNAEAIAEPLAESSIVRLSQDIESQPGSYRVPGKTNGPMKAVGRGGRNAFRGQGAERTSAAGPANRNGRSMKDVGTAPTRNKRSVWEIATQYLKSSHFATFPEKLVEPCVLAGSKEGDLVLDNFAGSATTCAVAKRLSRRWCGIELSRDYCRIAEDRLRQEELF